MIIKKTILTVNKNIENHNFLYYNYYRGDSLDINKKEVAKRIKNIRLKKGITMVEYGKLIDPIKPVKTGVISNWENGKQLPNKSRLMKIAEIGNVSIDELLYGDDYDYLSVGKQVYDDIINAKFLNEYDLKSLNYFKDTYEFESILIYSIKNILSVPFLEEVFTSPQDIIDKLPSHNSVIYFYFLQTFKDYYKEMVKTNENLILNTLDSLYYLKPDEDINRYPESMKIEYDKQNIYYLDIIEDNMSDQLVDDIDKILDKAMKKIKELQNKYSMADSKKIAYLYKIDLDNKDKHEQFIREIEIHPQNFKSKKEYIDYLENFINEYYQKHK